MTRTVLSGGRVFDGTGADPADADVAIEDGRIVGLGSGLDGDDEVDVRDRTILPGLFDCHAHVTISDVDLWGAVQQPFSRQFFEAAGTCRRRSRSGSPRPRRGRRRPRDQGGRRRRADRSARGSRSRSSCSARPAATATTGIRPGARCRSWSAPGPAVRARRRRRRGPPQGPRAPPAWAPTSSRSRRRAGSSRRATIRATPTSGRPSSRRSSRRRPRRGSSSWPTPRAPTGSRTPSGRGSARSTTASTSTTRRSS